MAQQVKATATVHRALDRLQPADLALHRSGAPRQRQGGDKAARTAARSRFKEVYNGDIGAIVGLDAEEGELAIDFDGRLIPYPFGELDQVTLA